MQIVHFLSSSSPTSLTYIAMAKEDDGPSYTFHPSNERLYCGTRVQVCFSNAFECPSCANRPWSMCVCCVCGGLHVRPIAIEINTSSKGNFRVFSKYKTTKTSLLKRVSKSEGFVTFSFRKQNSVFRYLKFKTFGFPTFRQFFLLHVKTFCFRRFFLLKIENYVTTS